MRHLIWLAAFALACNNKTDDTAATGDDGTGGGGGDDAATFEDYINVTDSPSGDFTGFDGFDANGGWLTQDLNPDAVGTAPLGGTVTDFESDDPVQDATLEMWFSDSASGASDLKTTSDSSGQVSGGDVPTCTALTYKVMTDHDLGETKDTYEAHQVYGAVSTIDDAYNSVSVTTYRLIPGLLGVDPDLEKGIAAGTAFDVNEDPIEGAQIIVVDDDDNIAPGVTVKYFVDDYPNRDQPYTSADGLWVAINVPVGTWNYQMWVSDGAGGHKLMGSSRASNYADSINIANLYTGYGDGVKYPDSCLN